LKSSDSQPIGNRRIPNPHSQRWIHFFLDGEKLPARQGETIAGAMLANGHQQLRNSSRNREPRGAFCGIGLCFECLVTVDGRPNVQSCLLGIEDGMQVVTQDGTGAWPEKSS